MAQSRKMKYRIGWKVGTASNPMAAKRPSSKRKSASLGKPPIKEEMAPTNEEIAEALIKTWGRITTVSRMLKISRYQLYERIKKHSFLEKAFKDSRRGMVEFAESCLMRNVAAGDQRAIEFVLKNKGKGWNAGAQDEPANDLGVVINIFETALTETKPASLPDNIIDVTANHTT